jgi:Zn-dependent alcohol dehydrogenase
MTAAILKAIGQPLAIEDIPEPRPGAGEVLVHTFPLEQINQAVLYAHEHGGAFQLTVLKPTSI